MRKAPVATRIIMMGAAILSAGAGAMAQVKPVPLINQPLVPDAIAPGGPAFTLTVNGTGFVAKSKVNWNGSPRATTMVSKSQLTAKITAADIAKAATATITVVSPPPTGGTSNAVFFPISTPTPTVGIRIASTVPAGDSLDAVVAGDFNGDGKLDMAVANYEDGTIDILEGDGAGNFTVTSIITLARFQSKLAVGDFNGDGKLDLVSQSGQAQDDVATILLGDGNGNFTPYSSIITGDGASAIAVGDFNKDGNLDVAVSSAGRNNLVAIFLGDGQGNLVPGSSVHTGKTPNCITVGDFNGDNKLDLAVGNHDDGTVSILLGDGSGNFTLFSSPAVGRMPQSVAAGDFNGDGSLDLAVAGIGNGEITILLGDGTGNFTRGPSAPAGAADSMEVGDFNGDGKPDLAASSNYDGTAFIMLGDGTGKFTVTSTTVLPGANGLAIGDFNNDGRLDAGIADFSKDSLSVLLQSPSVTLSPGSLTFAGQLLGTTSAPQTVTMTNIGYSAVDISRISITRNDPTDFSETNNCPASLDVGASCTIEVTFTPMDPGSRVAALSPSGDGGFHPVRVALSGTGFSITFNPSSLNFGNVMVGQSSPPMASTLTNIGSTPINITKILINGTDPNDFTETNNCPKNLAAGASCTITATFTPTQTGTRTAHVNVDYGVGSPQKIALSGTGT